MSTLGVLPETVVKSTITLNEIGRLDDELQRYFSSQFYVQPSLSRPLVSFQANKTRPIYRWYKFKFSHVFADHEKNPANEFNRRRDLYLTDLLAMARDRHAPGADASRGLRPSRSPKRRSVPARRRRMLGMWTRIMIIQTITASRK